MTETPTPSFWRGLFSGSDNATPAIGRVLGAVLGIILVLALLVSLPATIAVILGLQHVGPAVWFAFLAALTPYVTASVVAIGGLVVALVSGTAFTEPKPPAAS